MAVPSTPIVTVVPPVAAPTAVLQTFTRACGHTAALIHTPGDAAQAARYEATACVGCREPVISFAAGWNTRGRR